MTPSTATTADPVMGEANRIPSRGTDRAAAFRQRLAEEIGAHRFGLWFEHGTTAEAAEGGIRVVAASAYVADWITRHFDDAMRRAAAAVAGEGALVEVTLAETEPVAASATRARRTPSADPAVEVPAEGAGNRRAPAGRSAGSSGSRPATLRRLEDFVVGESNRLAFAAAQQVGDGASDAPAILFIHGECGVGKTHLVQGICRRRLDRAPRQVVRYVTAEQFTNEYIASVRDGSLETFRRRLRRVDLLCIDDIHFLANKTATQSEFLHTIDAIDLSGARVAMVSDEHPRHIRKFSQALVSRFLSGMVVRVERPDRQTRVSLVQRLARERGLDLTSAAEDAVAGRFAGSIREIEGAVTRLGALLELDGIRGQIGPGTVERLLLQDDRVASTAPIRLGAIVEAVCGRLRVTREDLVGRGRHQRTVVARGVVAHLARELTTHSFPEIARALGRPNHSAVHTAARRLRTMLDGGDGVAAANDAIGEPLREVVDQLRHDLSRPSRGRSEAAR
ncbi:MAG: DnaA ATPase domain-containing protein [Planctomycetota bacterium]